MYYIFLSVIISPLFIVPTRVYSKALHIHEYILSADISATSMTLSELAYELPVDLQLDFAYSIPMNMIIAIFIFLVLMSFSFLGKSIMINTGSLKEVLDPQKHFQ